MNKWSKRFWSDLAERVGATLVGALLTLLTANGVANLTPELAWTILGVPTLVSLLKGLLANLTNPESGASALPAPPGPDVVD